MERDLEGFREFFENPAFRADGLKIYPTLVIRGTGLYELWKTGGYRNYSPAALVDLVARVLSLVPPWTRVYRIQRDIPMPLVTSGVEHGNLRELTLARMRDLVRARDCAHAPRALADVVSRRVCPVETFAHARLASKTSITRCSPTRWSSFAATTWPTAGASRGARARYCVQARPPPLDRARWETFLSYEDPRQDILVGLLRLRKCR